MLGFGVVRVSSSLENWMLISSNCSRRIHNGARVASDLVSNGVVLGGVALGLQWSLVLCPECVISNWHTVRTGGAVVVWLGHG